MHKRGDFSKAEPFFFPLSLKKIPHLGHKWIMKRALLLAALLFLCFSGAALAGDAPAAQEKKDCPAALKDMSASPETVKNDGRGRVTLSCTALCLADGARISSVTADLRHTRLMRTIPFEPVEGQILSPSGDGRYEASLAIPELMDTGAYRVPVTVTDSAGCSATREMEFSIDFAPNPDTAPIGSPAFAAKLAAFAQSPLTRGNAVLVLSSGPEALERRLSMVREAERQVNLESYTFDGSLADGDFMKALTRAAGRGVEVNLLLNADTQIPTGPLDSLRLFANGLAAELSEKARDEIEKSPAPGLARFLPGPEFQGVNLVFFSSASAPIASMTSFADHWLTRALDEKVPPAAARAFPEKLKERFAGPGGMPSLPLLAHGLHEKILVTDGRYAVLGGRNLEDRYFTHWKDLDLYLEGPAVNEVQRAFMDSYGDATALDSKALRPTGLLLGGRKKGSAEVLFVHNLPWRGDYRTLDCAAYALSACRERAYLSSQFLALPGCLLADAIMDAAKRGVDVRIFTNGPETSRETSFAMGFMVSLNHMGKLLESGVRIFTAKGAAGKDSPQPYLHSKEFILDDKLLAVGSFNLSLRSSYIESENLCFVFDPSLAKQRGGEFLQAIEKNAEELSPEKLAEMQKEHRAAMEMARYVDLLF